MRYWPFIFIALLAALPFGCASEPKPFSKNPQQIDAHTVSDIKSIGDNVYSNAASATINNVVYDDLYRVTSVNSTARGTKSYGYNPIGNVLTNGDFGSGLYSYGAKPHAVTSANGMNYGYDACGNMTTRGSQTLTYDEQNQLASVSTTNGTVRFGYDGAGERVWRCGTNGYSVWIGGIYEINNGKVLCHVFAGGKRLTSFEPLCGSGFAKIFGEENWYLASTKVESIFNWPFQNGRGQWTMFGGTWAAILGVCMTAGRRVRIKHYEIRKAIRGSMLWKQTVTLVSISAFLWASAPEVQAAPTYGPVFYYYHNDNLGSSNVLTDRSGSMVQHYEYATFGQSSYQNNTSAYQVSNRYTGQICDDETGLYYYNARYYDPQMGRFIQPDTTVQSPDSPQTLNRYSYCGNNPINCVDPSGHFFGGFLIALVVVMLKAAVVGAAIGAAYAAWTGGDIGMGALTGAIGAAGVAGFGIIGGAVAGAINAEITGGDVGKGALFGALTTAISLGVGYFSENYIFENMHEGLVKEVAETSVSSATAGATAELNGGDFWQGFTFTAALSGANLINGYARLATHQNSELDTNAPDNTTGISRNTTGESDSFWKGGFFSHFKGGGARFDQALGDAPDSPLGGPQGGPGDIFGWPYSHGSFRDNLVEAYSGIHDFLNSFSGYNKYGDASHWGGAFGRIVRTTANYIDIPIATPFAAASLMSAYHPLLISLPAVNNKWWH